MMNDRYVYNRLAVLSKINMDESLQDYLKDNLKAYMDFISALFFETPMPEEVELRFENEGNIENCLRKDDKAIEFNFRTVFLSNAPKVHNGEIVVPEVIQRA